MSHITRRVLIGTAAKGGLAVGASGLIAACGSSASTSSSSVAAADPATYRRTPKHGGTLSVGMSGGSSSDTLEPNSLLTAPDFARAAAIYDALVWQDAAGEPELRVAESVTPNKDATVWTIRLRKGVIFHNGREATADDLMFSLKRVANPKSPGVAAIILTGIKLAGMKKLDRYTVSVPFSQPYSTFYESLGNEATVYLLPTEFDPQKPIGTGPFKLSDFVPGQQSVMVAHTEYWNHPLPYLDKLIITDYADETSQVNALLGGQVQAVNLLSQDTLRTVTASGKRALISPGGGFVPFTMRVDEKPFSDVRVRQAFRLIVNRDKINRLVFGGHGTIGNDVFGIWSSDYNHALPQREQDIEQAKSLLKRAGQEHMTIQLVTAPIAQGAVNMAQLLAEDAALAGVKINLRQVTATDFFGPNYTKWVFGQDYSTYTYYFPEVALTGLPASPYNTTHFDDPTYNKLYAQALATTAVAKRREIAHEMQMIDYDRGGYILPVFPPVIDGYAENIHGATLSRSGASFNLGDFEHLWMS